MSNYGGKEMRDLRKGAAASDKEFAGAGQRPGLEIWRVSLGGGRDAESLEWTSILTRKPHR